MWPEEENIGLESFRPKMEGKGEYDRCPCLRTQIWLGMAALVAVVAAVWQLLI